MIFSCLSKFKGALIGALIGENLAINQGKINFDLYEPSSGLKKAMLGIKTLNNYSHLDFQSWLTNLDKNQVDLLKIKNSNNMSEIIISILPLTLFYYKNLDNITENLYVIESLCFDADFSRENLLIWVYIIKILLENQFNINHLIDVIKPLMNLEKSLNMEILSKIDSYLKTKSTLIEVSDYLQDNCDPNSMAIFQALYCFMAIPNDFSFCLKRCLYTKNQTQLTTTLTGILLGLYNSYDNVPFSWRLKIQQSLKGKEMLECSEVLFATWSGNYSLERINPQEIYNL